MKLLFLAPFGVVAVALLVVLAPFVLVYFLFDRFCSLVEELAPTKGRKGKESGGGRLGMLKKLFSAISPNVNPQNQARGLLPHQRPF